ncbi:alpha/beta fold hydrolase [Sciscionella sediminilitoris]|uniref:alpha/beta fold hydrolase n=1 Tax=Sciscionella sediminilitoris TaxID=1445613 RepID=UPI00056D19D5|nr:alpha/beta hydrolase [Sciscionella sp. SE31]
MIECRVDGVPVQVRVAGDPRSPPVVFLHGWPESARSWARLLPLAATEHYAVAIDLPGVGGSAGVLTDGSKDELADFVHAVLGELGLRSVTLVGHDIGGMVVYSYLRRHPLRAAVILNVAIPGVEPWSEVLRNPAIWHFAFHGVPELPERLVRGRERAYLDYFFDVLSAPGSEAIGEAERDAYAETYATSSALSAGFGWYRAFELDARRNAERTDPVDTPLLYLRGEHERGRLPRFAEGFRAAGVRALDHGLVPGAGHFAPEEAPDETWQRITKYL